MKKYDAKTVCYDELNREQKQIINKGLMKKFY